jgi:hypothetical protein
VWRAIHEGKGILQQGTIKRIGDGKGTLINLGAKLDS